MKYEKDRAWLAAHPGRAAEYSRKYYAANAEQCKRAKKEAYRKKCSEKYRSGESDGD